MPYKDAEKRKEHGRKYYAEHKEALREQARIRAPIYANRKKKYYEKIDGPKRAKMRKDNPEVSWAKDTVSNHKKYGRNILIPVEDLAHLVSSTKICPICKVSLKFKSGMSSPTLDRVYPVDTINSIEEVEILCRRCNITKSDRSPEELEIWAIQYLEYRRNKVR